MCVGGKTLHPLQEKETGVKLDLEETEGDVGEGRAAILDRVLQQNGREHLIYPEQQKGKWECFSQSERSNVSEKSRCFGQTFACNQTLRFFD